MRDGRGYQAEVLISIGGVEINFPPVGEKSGMVETTETWKPLGLGGYVYLLIWYHRNTCWFNMYCDFSSNSTSIAIRYYHILRLSKQIWCCFCSLWHCFSFYFINDMCETDVFSQYYICWQFKLKIYIIENIFWMLKSFFHKRSQNNCWSFFKVWDQK